MMIGKFIRNARGGGVRVFSGKAQVKGTPLTDTILGEHYTEPQWLLRVL